MKITLICLFCICSVSLEPQGQEAYDNHYFVILKILNLRPKVTAGKYKGVQRSAKQFKDIRSNRLNNEIKEDIKKHFRSQKASEYPKLRKAKKEIVRARLAYQLAELQKMLVAIDALKKTQTTWTRV